MRFKITINHPNTQTKIDFTRDGESVEKVTNELAKIDTIIIQNENAESFIIKQKMFSECYITISIIKD